MVTAKARATKRAPLSPQKIADAALAYIDKYGLEALSTRKLGAKLGVEGMALYKHFPSKDALLDAVAESLVAEFEVPATGTWQEFARHLGHNYRAIARRHPKAYLLFATRRFTTPRALALLDAIFSRLLTQGMKPQDAVELYRAVLHYCTGAILDELAGYAMVKRGAPQGAVAPPDELGSLKQVFPWLGTDQFDALYEAGLNRVVGAFER